jgi:hypothetical protein
MVVAAATDIIGVFVGHKVVCSNFSANPSKACSWALVTTGVSSAERALSFLRLLLFLATLLVVP